MDRFRHPVYLNFDNPEDRNIITKLAWPGETDLLVLDEIHKMPEWKNRLKGIYDTRPEGQRILVTGSARLDTFRQGGDSLAGRYYLHRLLPISPSEARAVGSPPNTVADLPRFMGRGGFPEPFLAEEEADAGRWRRQYLDGLIREDILTFENVRELRSMTLLVELLRDRVGSLLSFQSLAEDLGVAPNTVKRHIEILEALYIVFRVLPHSRNIARALIKQPKLYFFDTGLVRGGIGPQFENLVALSLFERQTCLEDRDGKVRSLRYLRTKEGREVDFVLVQEETPTLLVEAKASEREITSGLRYFSDRLPAEAVQVVMDLRQEREEAGIKVLRAAEWLANLES